MLPIGVDCDSIPEVFTDCKVKTCPQSTAFTHVFRVIQNIKMTVISEDLSSIIGRTIIHNDNIIRIILNINDDGLQCFTVIKGGNNNAALQTGQLLFDRCKIVHLPYSGKVRKGTNVRKRQRPLFVTFAEEFTRLNVTMKILLINPPRSPENNILKFAPEEAKHYIHKKLIGPPLGLLTIASAVKDHDVVLFDAKGEYDLDPATPPLPELVKKLLEIHKPGMVGVTTITSEFDYSIEIFQTVKAVDPSILTVAGGLHATLCPMDFTDPSVDVVIPGQCTHIFRDVVNAKEAGRDLSSIPGILINSNDGLTRTKGTARLIDNIEEDYLFPDRSHLQRWIDTYKVGGSPFPSTYVYTSLGCPYRCTFCSIWTQFRGKYFQRSVESLITELKSIDEYPVVRFADANTIVDLDFICLLFDRIREEGIIKTIIMDIRADIVVQQPDLIEKLAKGGLKVVICGFESFRDKELKQYHKDSPARYNHEAIKIFEQNGIMVRGNYVIPVDYGVDDFEALAEYSSRYRVVYAGYTILTPMPGTVYYNQVKNQIIDKNYKKYNFFNSVMKTALPHDEFHERVGALWLIKKGDDVI